MRTQLVQMALVHMAVLLAILDRTTAHPHQRIQTTGCLVSETDRVASEISCGDASTITYCIANVGAAKEFLKACLSQAGCAEEQSEREAAWAVERCLGADAAVDNNGLELRQVHARDDATTTATSTTSDSTASSTSTSSSSSTTTSTTSTATTTTASTASSTSTSTSATTSSSSTSTSTSSTASATSTSSSDSTNSGVPKVGYFVAVVLALYVAGCIGYICFSCCSERTRRKKAIRLADEKEALASMRG